MGDVIQYPLLMKPEKLEQQLADIEDMQEMKRLLRRMLEENRRLLAGRECRRCYLLGYRANP
jgi:hypothetical protein